MKTTSLRARTLACALLATTAYCGLTAQPAAAQTADTPPPLRLRVDENGVDLARAVHTLNVRDIAIGPEGRGGLAYVRQLGRSSSRNLYDMGIFASGSSLVPRPSGCAATRSACRARPTPPPTAAARR